MVCNLNQNCLKSFLIKKYSLEKFERGTYI
jgi:hypothetical protein